MPFQWVSNMSSATTLSIESFEELNLACMVEIVRGNTVDESRVGVLGLPLDSLEVVGWDILDRLAHTFVSGIQKGNIRLPGTSAPRIRSWEPVATFEWE